MGHITLIYLIYYLIEFIILPILNVWFIIVIYSVKIIKTLHIFKTLKYKNNNIKCTCAYIINIDIYFNYCILEFWTLLQEKKTLIWALKKILQLI